MTGTVLAVLAPEWHHLLQPDACGGRAPRMVAPFEPVAMELEPVYGGVDRSVWACPGCNEYMRRPFRQEPWTSVDISRIAHLPTCPLWALVLHHPTDPRVGHRGLATAAEAVMQAEGLVTPPGSVVWWELRATLTPRVVLDCSHDDPPGQWLRSTDSIPEAVGAVLVRLGVATRTQVLP